jgi:hypothetical protein
MDVFMLTYLSVVLFVFRRWTPGLTCGLNPRIRAIPGMLLPPWITLFPNRNGHTEKTGAASTVDLSLVRLQRLPH